MVSYKNKNYYLKIDMDIHTLCHPIYIQLGHAVMVSGKEFEKKKDN